MVEEASTKCHNDQHVGIGMDSAVLPVRNHPELSLVQSVDFFYPLVDDPYTMGRIALANVVSDIYAVGVLAIDKLAMILSACTDFTDQEREVVMPLIMQGFIDGAREAGCRVKVQNIAENPWCIIGGVVTSVCLQEEIIIPKQAVTGDKLILTKPLGTQLATNAHLWFTEKSDSWQKLSTHISPEEIEATFARAVKSMTTLNKIGATLMHKYNAHAATDVTGFGLIGHAENLCKFQNAQLDFVLDTLPIIKNVRSIAEILERTKKLLTGWAVETSGGLLICLPAENAEAFCNEFEILSGDPCWIIGDVVAGTGRVELRPNPTIIEVL